MNLETHFIEGRDGRIFCVNRSPSGDRKHPTVLVIPPYAEEMNKCRRMISICCQKLSERGIASVVPDLYGTGDSDGIFAEACWEGWREDLSSAAEEITKQGADLCGVLALRMGCLLAADWFSYNERYRPQQTIFWQPVESVIANLKPMLRARALQSQMSGEQVTVDGLLGDLQQGKDVFAAGYQISSSMFASAYQLSLKSLLENLPEVAPYNLIVSRMAAKAQRTNAWEERYPGDPYWSSVEIVSNQAVIQRTVELFETTQGPGKGQNA